MKRWEREAAVRLPELLRRWLAIDSASVRVRNDGLDDGVDLLAEAGGLRMFVQVTGTDNLASLESAESSLRRSRTSGGIAIVVVPFMGPKAREWARERRIAWGDLSGNAEIHQNGLHVYAEGWKNRYATDGRASNAFAPRFSRVTRVLLADTKTWWKQRDLTAETGLPDGTVSKAVHRLAAIDLLERDAAGRIRARAPSLLLDA